MPRFPLLFTLILSSLFVQSQNHPVDYFRAPLDIPMVLSGTFGELRSNHFHAGIDIKTKGASGLKVYAVADGYVSRIKVSPWGYGKAIYITHSNGYTSVYAHLKSYHGSIEDYVYKAQYKEESYSIELFPKKEELRVKKGELIAFSGNSGSSAAPHLHFELRTSNNEHPQNGLQFGFDIKDEIPPVIREIKVTPRGKTSQVNQQNFAKTFKPISKNGTYRVETPISIYGSASIGIYTHDLLDGANNKNGVYSIELIIDKQQIYYHQMDEFGFHETRYINSHIDYAEKQQSKKRLHSCYLEANNQLSIYEHIENNGIITPDSVHQGKFVVKDVYGNTSVLNFTLQKTDYTTPSNDWVSPPVRDVFSYQEAHIFKDGGLELHIPKNTLYDSLYFQYNVSSDTLANCYAPVHHVHNENVALHKSYAISIENTVSDSLKEKAFIAQIGDKGQTIYRGGKWVDGKLTTKLKSFGDFSVATDTLAPTIKPLNIYPNKLMTSSSLRMNIRDDLSGIKSYRAEIDGKWVLMEFDPKRARLTHYFKKSLQKGEHTFTLEVVDDRGNIAHYHVRFSR